MVGLSTDLMPFLDEAVASCDALTRAEALHFVEHGHVIVKNAMPKAHAELVRERAWSELETEHGVDRSNPSTWAKPQPGRRPAGYARLKGTAQRYLLKTTAPRAFKAQADLVGGAARLSADGDEVFWGDGVISNLGIEDDPRWEPPGPKQPGWHKDGWHFRHFLNSPEQSLVTVPLYSDIQPRSGGTYLAVDSIAPVARLLRDTPQGLHPDSVQGAGFLIPGLIEQCTNFVELTGEAGDVAFLHPYMMHRVSINASTRPRFIANMAPVLKEPMCFKRPQGEAYSLVELAVLHALSEPSYDFQQTRDMQGFKPFPFREEGEREAQQALLRNEMRSFAERGIVTPAWSAECGYMTNQAYA
ncbi:MAG: hypothetical protein F4W90_03910 [Gammaproteobacteria bacterium]|nr:hypothetical protein [Gammaproteobacteria bacterium]